MSVDQMVGTTETQAMDGPAEPYSVAWWHSRSTDELREMINRGFGVGDLSEGATVETERRARERQKAEQQAVQAKAVRNKRFRLLTLETILLAFLALLIAELLSR